MITLIIMIVGIIFYLKMIESFTNTVSNISDKKK